MSCTNPNLMKFFLDPDTGSVEHTFEGPARRFDPATFGDASCLKSRGYYYMPVPCGKCPDCRADLAREWSNRCLLELEDNDNIGCFVTLTYNDFNLPIDDDGPTLRKRDFQLFMKRLRFHFQNSRIRFFACGEYGSRTHRPHYHVILFGLGLQDFPDAFAKKCNKLGQPLFVSDTLSKIWPYGYHLIGSVTKESCDYVARYTLKKQLDLDDDGKYPLHVVPPFTLASRRPGIGMLRRDEILLRPNLDERIVCDGHNGTVYTFPVPKSFIKSAKASEFLLDKILEKSYNDSIAGNIRLLSDLASENLSYPDYLDKHQALRRSRLKLLDERSDCI